MIDLLVLIITTLVTAGYAALMMAIADKSPGLAAAGSIIVAVLWFIIGHIYFF